MKVKSIITLLFLSIFFINCGKETSEKNQFKNYKLRKEVQSSVDSLSVIDKVYLKGTLRYTNLLKVASMDDLVYLTNHKIPTIRCYAFIGLMTKNYPKLKDIFLEHLKDTAVVQTRYDCVGERETVMKFMLEYFHPRSLQSKIKFNQNEFDKYYQLAKVYQKKIKPEQFVDYEKEIRKRQSDELSYFSKYFWSYSNDKKYLEDLKLVKKGVVTFVRYEDMVLATAYFDVNSYINYFPNVERRGDTVVLKQEVYKKYPCDEKLRVIQKVIFVINDNQISKIKKVIVE